MSEPAFRSVIVTGASSGIGAALAERLARPGTRLGLLARNAERLAAVGAACEARGAAVAQATIDVREHSALADWIARFDRETPVDLVVANAGVTSGRSAEGRAESVERFHEVTAINYLGIVNVVEAIAPVMASRGHGTVALMASIGGLYGLPDSPAYSAAKAAVLSYGQSLAARLRPDGVNVSVICPGYVTTPMSRKVTGVKPMEVSVEQAVDRIVAGLERRRFMIAFPRRLAFGSRLLAWLPMPIATYFVNRFRFAVDIGLERTTMQPGPRERS